MYQRPRFFYAAILCLGFMVKPLLINAQGVQGYSLTGTIRNAATKEVLPGASLTLADLKRTVVANQEGYFRMTAILPGHHVIEIAHVGFATQVLHIEILESLTKDFLLSPVFVENQEVVVTGITSPTSNRKMAVPIAVMKQTALQQTAATNIVDAISRIPGVSQLTTGPAISKPIIRGLGSNRVVVVNDGIRQEGQQWGDEHGLEIDESSINRAEVLKGPASLLYGSDALGGVIHFLSAPPVEEGTIKGRSVSGYQSNGNLYSLHHRLAGNNGRWFWSGYTSLKSAGDYTNRYDGKVFNARFAENNWGGQLGVNKKWGYSQVIISKFTQRLGVIEGERDIQTGQFLVYGGTPYEHIASVADLRGRTPFVPNQLVDHFKVVTDHSFTWGKSRFKGSLGWQQNQRKEYGHVEEPSHENLFFDLKTLNYSFQWQLPEKKEWHTTLGFSGMQQQNQNRGEERLIPDYQLNDAGLFLFAQRVQDKISWSGGLRIDRRAIQGEKYFENGQPKFNAFQKDFVNWSGSVGVSYEPTTSLVLKANMARGFRAPSLSELASNGAHEGTNRYEYGQLNLGAETSLQSDIGLEWQAEHFGIGVSAFYNQLRNFIFYRKLTAVGGGDSLIHQGGDLLTAFIYQQQPAQLKGLELTIDIHPHPLDWLHIENNFSLVSGRFSTAIDPVHSDSYWLPLLPAPRWSSEIRGDFKKGWRAFRSIYCAVNAQKIFTQHQFFTGFSTETSTPGYFLVDLGAGAAVVNQHKKTVATFHFSITNLGDVAWQSHTSRLKYTAVNATTGRMGVFNRGRNYAIRLIIPFSWSIK